MNLAQAGYGSVDFVLGSPSDIFMMMVWHNEFISEMRAEDYALNRKK